MLVSWLTGGHAERWSPWTQGEEYRTQHCWMGGFAMRMMNGFGPVLDEHWPWLEKGFSEYVTWVLGKVQYLQGRCWGRVKMIPTQKKRKLPSELSAFGGGAFTNNISLCPITIYSTGYVLLFFPFINENRLIEAFSNIFRVMASDVFSTH